MKRIAHIDLNAFFCQCEILQDPSLKGKPIAVGSVGKRGVISTASYEARKMGVHSALSTTIARKRCPQLILIDGNFSLYQFYSQKFFSYLKERFPILEQASIDECYIDMTDEMAGVDDEEGFLFDLQMEIYHQTMLKCSIGLSYNRFLAKMASDMKKPLGITIISKNDVPLLIHPLPIEDFYGIGKKTSPLLKEQGILTIGDLAHCDSDKIRSILGSTFDYFKGEANGIGSDVVDASSYDPKSISSERTFKDDVTSYEELRTMIHKCLMEIVEELRSYNKLATCVSLKLRDDHFVTRSRRMALSRPSDELNTLFEQTMRIFDDFYHDEPIRLLGVCAEKIIDKVEKKENRTDDIINEINSSLVHGGKIIKGDELK